MIVIPAKAGIQFFQLVRILWTPVCTGETTFYETITLVQNNFFTTEAQRGIAATKTMDDGRRTIKRFCLIELQEFEQE